MKAKLFFEGREVEVEVSDVELKKLIAARPNAMKTGYKRREGDVYYYDYNGIVDSDVDENLEVDDSCYNAANYYSDKTVAENNARADELMRQLRRFAVEHRENEIDWNDGPRKYFIYNAGNTNNLKIDYCYRTRYFGGIFFDTPEAAKLAIETFKDELIWYFTEYKDSL